MCYNVAEFEVRKGVTYVTLSGSNGKRVHLAIMAEYIRPTECDLYDPNSRIWMWVNKSVLSQFTGRAANSRRIKQWEMDRHLYFKNDMRHANGYIYDAWLKAQ